MMKRTFAVVISVLLMGAMAGCGTQTDSSVHQQNSSPTQTSVSAPSTAEPSQASQSVTNLYAYPDSFKMKIDEKRLLTINSDKGTESPSNLMFVCDDNDIAMVDSSGNVIGRAPGECEITASLRDQPSVSVKVKVTVKPDSQSSDPQPSVTQTTSSPENNDSGKTTVIVVTAPGSDTVSAPSSYTYYYGRDNFSYSTPSDGYLAYSMINTYLTESDVARLSKNDAQFLLNTIYAKYGFSFDLKHIQNFFEQQVWYTSIGNNDIALANLEATKNKTDIHNFGLLLSRR